MLRRLALDLGRAGAGVVLASPALRRLAGAADGRGITIFYYHRVFSSDDQPVYQLGISRDLFRAQLRDLARVHRFVPLMDALNAAGDLRPGTNLAALTFDDGYRDNLTEALPVLRELGIPATIFLVAGLVGGRRLVWYDEVKTVVERAGAPGLRLPGGLAGRLGREMLEIEDLDARRRGFEGILGTLKSLEDRERREAVRDLAAVNGVDLTDPSDRDAFLSWEEARRMEEQDIRFGSHTMTHPLLSRIADPDVLRGELAGSMALLRENLRYPLPVLAYPGGDWTPRAVGMARECGYRWGMANRPGVVSAETDPMLVPRRALGPMSSLFMGRRHSRAVLLCESRGVLDGLRSARRVPASSPAPAPPGAATPSSSRTSPASAPEADAGAGNIVAASFDGRAQAYQATRAADPAFSGEEARILEMLPPPSGMLLDVGSGVGITAIKLARLGWSVIATDLSLGMLQQVRQNAAAAGTTLSGVVRCDVQRLPFRDAGVAAVVSHGVLEYVPDIPAALAEMERVLVAGGAVITTVPNRRSPASRVSSVLKRLAAARARLRGRRITPVPSRHLVPGRLDALAGEAGLERREGVLETFTLMPLAYFPRRWLALNNRIVNALPRSPMLRWWGAQYIGSYRTTRRTARDRESGSRIQVDRESTRRSGS